MHVRDSVRTVLEPGPAPCVRGLFTSPGSGACACVLWGAPWVPRAERARGTSGCVCLSLAARAPWRLTLTRCTLKCVHRCPLEQMRNKDPSEGSGPVDGYTRSGIFFFSPSSPPSAILSLPTSRYCPAPVVSGVSPGWSHVTSVFVPRPVRVPAALGRAEVSEPASRLLAIWCTW